MHRRTQADLPVIRLRDLLAEQSYKHRQHRVGLCEDYRVTDRARMLCDRLQRELTTLEPDKVTRDFNTLTPCPAARRAISEYIGQVGISRFPESARHLLLILTSLNRKIVESEIAGEASVAVDAKVVHTSLKGNDNAVQDEAQAS